MRKPQIPKREPIVKHEDPPPPRFILTPPLALVPVPQSDANREWYLQQHQNGIAQGSGMVQNEAANAALMKLARKGPNYERNLPKICSFFEKGECNRGSRCPFRHEKAREGEGKGNMDQDIRDRWFGKGEGGGAARGIERHEQNKQKISAPADHTIKTLYVGDLGEWGNEKVSENEGLAC